MRLVLFFSLGCWLLTGCSGDNTTSDAGPDVLTVADTGSDVDNGEVSTNYPAPHPPLPTIVNAQHGPVLTTPHVYLVFFPSYSLEAKLDAYATAMAASTYWATTTSEYGVGPMTYEGTIDLTETPPTSTTQADIETWVAAKIQSGAFGTPDPQAIYTIVYPSTTTVTEPNPVSTLFGTVASCQDFYGYHDNVTVTLGATSGDGGVDDAGTSDAGDGGDFGDAGEAGAPDAGDGGDAGGGQAVTFAYAVIPTCGPLYSLTETMSHEWVEASTDPQVTSGGTFVLTAGPNSAFFGPDPQHLVWALIGGGEAGDMCGVDGLDVYIAPADLGGNSVQRTWSNASGQASHDPCVPLISGAFFDSVPVLPETVTVSSPLIGTVTTQGVTIPQNQSKTIEVDLFSDGDTGGPWTVSAADLLSSYYGSFGVKPTLDFAWDRTSGQNGEKLHLTISVTGPSLVQGIHAFMITSQLGTRTTIWPGLVAE